MSFQRLAFSQFYLDKNLDDSATWGDCNKYKVLFSASFSTETWLLSKKQYIPWYASVLNPLLVKGQPIKLSANCKSLIGAGCCNI
jgi:hypothetical protein